MENPQTAPAESSPANQTFEPPRDPAANLEWRKTGELPAASEKTPKADSTPAAETASASRSSEEDAARTAPESAPGTKQERAKQPTAADRLNDILADLRRAGLSPAELKTFKREAQAAAAETTPAKAAPEKTANPQDAPVKPKLTDRNADGSDKYKTFEEFDEAKDKWHEDVADYKANQAVAKDRQARAEEAQRQTLAQKLTDAKARYGEETEAKVGEAVRAVSDEGVPLVIRQLINESPVLVDAMYVLNSNAEDLAAFVELAKSNPGAAIRKFALIEQLVETELAKGSKAAAAGTEDASADDTAGTGRDASGKFVSQDPPAKKKPAAPPPPEELSTRGSAPPDPIEAAVRADDFTAFKAEEDRRDRAQRRGA